MLQKGVDFLIHPRYYYGMVKYPEKNSYIYILIDPRDNWVVYVGTTFNMQRRISELSNDQRGNYGKAVDDWRKELKDLGLSPALQIVAECLTDDRREVELYWINHYLNEGYDLLNHQGVGPIFEIRQEKNFDAYKKRATPLSDITR